MSEDTRSMGEYEEAFLGPEDPEAIPPETEWCTAQGQLVRICDMADRHLLNTIRVLRRRSPRGTTFKTTPERRRRWLNAMADEAYRRNLEIDELNDGEPVHE